MVPHRIPSFSDVRIVTVHRPIVHKMSVKYLYIDPKARGSSHNTMCRGPIGLSGVGTCHHFNRRLFQSIPTVYFFLCVATVASL